MKPLENMLIVCEFMLEVKSVLKQSIDCGVHVNYIYIEFGPNPKPTKTHLLLSPVVKYTI